MKLFYYEFWMESSGRPNHKIIRLYKGKPTQDTLDVDLAQWIRLLPWNISSSKYYGYKRVKKSQLPKNRADCLKVYWKAVKRADAANAKKRLYENLLGTAPYNGLKV